MNKQMVSGVLDISKIWVVILNPQLFNQTNLFSI